MLRTLMYATDLGPYSAYDLAYVEQLARSQAAKVVMVHVVPPLEPWMQALFEPSGTLQPQFVASRLEAMLASIREQTVEWLLEDEFGIDFAPFLQDVLVLAGPPARIIVDQAQRCQVDVIVLGRHSSHSQGVEPELGSVARKVLQLSSVPVLFLPQRTRIEVAASAHHINPVAYASVQAMHQSPGRGMHPSA
jgi:nucleotide-binding universal stress UspA family protein